MEIIFIYCKYNKKKVKLPPEIQSYKLDLNLNFERFKFESVNIDMFSLLIAGTNMLANTTWNYFIFLLKMDIHVTNVILKSTQNVL